MNGFCSVPSVLTGFDVPTRMLRFWKSAGWVFHLSVLICSNDSILVCKYRELLCCSILLTFLIALYSVLQITTVLPDCHLGWPSFGQFSSLLASAFQTASQFAGFYFIPTNSSNLCDCKNVSSASRCLLSLDSVVPANHMFLQHLTVLLPFL